MSAVLPIAYLLTHNPGMQELVLAESIMPGDLPINQPLPAISIEQVDGVPHNSLSLLETGKTWRDRVQVTAHVNGPAASKPGLGYPGIYAMLNAALAACPNQQAIINGIKVLAIIPDDRGPYMSEQDTARVSQSQDFIVYWQT